MEQALKMITNFLKISKMSKTLKVFGEEIEERKPFRISIKEIMQFNR